MLAATGSFPWWGWVLIGVGVIALGALKLFIFDKIKKNHKAKDESKKDINED